MNNYNPYVCDFALEAKKAKKWTKEQLLFNIQQAREAYLAGVNPDKYIDQISVYKAELAKRR